MTKIYTYCLFDNKEVFYGVYSSLKAVHRDAIKICNRGTTRVLMEYNKEMRPANLTELRNVLKGECDVYVLYKSDAAYAKILKTKLRE
jgi:hypothetical protein|tara:strand:+ start:1754 stop:2017 length:264 start_codon:yes stop_codon:yes gene_type:complete